MSPRSLVLPLLLSLGILSAQPSSTAEIHGTVIELGPNIGLAGAEVTLTEFVPRDKDLDPKTFGTVFTDSRGTFDFKPGHLGDFRLDVKKAGYVNRDNGPGGSPRSLFLVLTTDQPSQEFSFHFMRPSSLTGRVVDEDGKPVPDFPVAITPSPRISIDIRATTDSEGVFTAPDVSPGSYLVRVAPKSGILETAIDFTEDAFKMVDRDIDVSYWPGDAPDAGSALPMLVAPGAEANLGTITLRKTNYYRVHVSVSGDCASGEQWSYSVSNASTRSTQCAKELLLRSIKSGSHTFFLWNGKQDAEIRWGLVPIEIGSENVHVSLTLAPGTDVPGRFILPEGAAVSSLGGTRVRLRAESRYPRLFDGIVTPDAAGKFVARNLPWTSYSVSFAGLPTSYYVKEIRYNNAPVPNASLTLFPGASLEIVLDDHPAAITGRVVNGDKPVPRAEILLSKWPPPPGPAMLEGSMFSVAMLANNDGLFRVGGLAPGEYRVAAFSAEASPQAIASLDLNGLLSRGEKVTLERGGQQTVQLKLIK